MFEFWSKLFSDIANVIGINLKSYALESTCYLVSYGGPYPLPVFS